MTSALAEIPGGTIVGNGELSPPIFASCLENQGPEGSNSTPSTPTPKGTITNGYRFIPGAPVASRFLCFAVDSTGA